LLVCKSYLEIWHKCLLRSFQNLYNIVKGADTETISALSLQCYLCVGRKLLDNLPKNLFVLHTMLSL